MFAGHFGVAASVKGVGKQVPVWALMISTQLLDLAFIVFYFLGLENFGDPIQGTPYISFQVDYSHSLAGALLLSILAGLVTARLWGKNGGIIIGLVSFSHWILDLLVHVPDLPILPDNIGNLPYLGLGLWQYPVAAVSLEGILVGAGIFLYSRYVFFSSGEKRKRAALVKITLMTVFLAGIYILGLI